MAEKLTLIEHGVCYPTLVGSCSENITFSEHATGTVTFSGTSRETISFTEKTSGYLSNLAHSVERISFAERVSGGSISLATSKETLTFKERLIGSLPQYGVSRETLSLSESSKTPAAGTSRESISFSEKALGMLVETPDGVWVVNLTTGGHSRYTGDLTGATPVQAYILTGISQLGSDRAKHVPDAYLHLRANGDVELTTITNEQIERSGNIIPDDDREGLHRRRVKLAKGIKGTNWQFKISNVDGSDFTVKTLEISPEVSSRYR